MGTTYVVGVDFQLRLGVDLGGARSQQVLVAELGQCFLGLRVDMNPTVKDRLGSVTNDAAEHLVAGAVRYAMLNVGVIVDHLTVARQIDAVQIQMGTLTQHIHLIVDTLEAAALGQGKTMKTRVALQVNVHTAHMQQVFLLQVDAVVLHLRVIANNHFSQAVDEAVLGVNIGGVVLDQLGLGVILQHQQQPLTGSDRSALRGADIQHIQRLFQTLTARHMHQYAISRPGIAQRGEQMTLAVDHTAKVLTDQCALLAVRLTKADDAGRQAAGMFAAEAAIDEHQAGRIQLQLLNIVQRLAVCRHAPVQLLILLKWSERQILPVLGLARRPARLRPGAGALLTQVCQPLW